jgi:hypothetical protein
MMRSLNITLLLIVSSVGAAASVTPTAPEIDAGVAGTAVALLIGGMLVLRARRRR